MPETVPIRKLFVPLTSSRSEPPPKPPLIDSPASNSPLPMMKSLAPKPPVIVSAPGPPVILLLPSPALMTSLPEPPLMMSSPLPETILSFPPLPLIVSPKLSVNWEKKPPVNPLMPKFTSAMSLPEPPVNVVIVSSPSRPVGSWVVGYRSRSVLVGMRRHVGRLPSRIVPSKQTSRPAVLRFRQAPQSVTYRCVVDDAHDRPCL